MSYPGLVGHADHPQASSEKLLNQIILFVVERGATEMADRGRMINGRPVFFVNERAFARFPNPVRHYVHRVIQRNFCPLFRARRAIFHFCFATRMREQLKGRRAFRTKVSLTDRRLRVALDRNQFAVLVINELTATDSAVRANRAGDA